MAVDRTRYDFNGKERLTKKALIYEAVNKYIETSNEELNIELLKRMFSEKSDFKIDMFTTEEIYKNFNEDKTRRYFDKPFELKNGVKIFLSNQWGGNIFQKLLNQLKNNLHYDIKEHKKEADKKMMNHENNRIRNIILYGSPGVGKTHNTNKLISLIENGISDKEIFETIKNNEVNNGIEVDDIKDRVKFVTFHQSFGYEDFIEGFRPNEEGNIELEEGVFKSLCQRAQKNLEDSRKPSEAIHKERKFNTILNDFTEKIENLLENNGIYPLTENIYIFDIEEDAFRYKGDNWNIHSAGLRMRFDILEKLYLTNVKSRQDVKKVDGIGGLATQHATYFWKFLEKLYTFESQKNVRVEDVQKVERKNYYLVIDEINRGNISKIFGELITLIEEDKRDTLEVTLPYSKQTFKIPSNLYIIGTMNSTDKSIALIDIALRRRFTFLKMEPKSDLVTHTKAQNVMMQLNEKITNTLGADYVLGHSYFMKIENNEDLEFVLEYKIKPLLEEYYYGDTEGLQNILEITDG